MSPLFDKIMLFRATKCEMPMPTNSKDQKTAFMQVLDAELPRFLNFVVNEYRIPEAIRCERYGVIHYHHKELMQMMDALSPETRLMDLMDTEIFGVGKGEALLEDSTEGWEGRASDLEAKLQGDHSGVKNEARKLMIYTNACGTYLGRLRATHPKRISSRILDGRTIWTIRPPSVGMVNVEKAV